MKLLLIVLGLHAFSKSADSQLKLPVLKVRFTSTPTCCSEAGTCNDVFIQSPEINGKVFLLPIDKKQGNWLGNFGLCRKHCAEMVILQSSEENDAFIDWFIQFIPTNLPLWLGGRFPFVKSINDKDFYWFSGAPINTSFHPNLHHTHPYHFGYNVCLIALWLSDSTIFKKWWRYSCDLDNSYFVCQRNVTVTDGCGL